MDTQGGGPSVLLQLLLSPPAFLLMITVIIVVHELGHFIAARLCGVSVAAFSLGFGPEIAAFTDRKGTRWRLALYPLGGYVRWIDDDNASSVPTTAERSDEEAAVISDEVKKGYYHLKPVWQRAIIAAAGPFANFLLAMVVFAAFFMFVGELQRPVRIDKVVPGMPAEAGGVKPGDIILSVNGTALPNFERLALIVNSSPERQLDLLVQRGDQQLTLQVTPKFQDDTDVTGGKIRSGKIGIEQSASDEEVKIKRLGPIEAVVTATYQVQLILEAGMRGIWDLVTARQPVSALAGPTKIFHLAGIAASLGIYTLIRTIAFVSIAIGMTNLLPIPILDGGHLVMYAIEAVRGKPLSQRTQAAAFRVGLALILMVLTITIVNHAATWVPNTIDWLRGRLA
jgi:regulator of sigma E protease